MIHIIQFFFCTLKRELQFSRLVMLKCAMFCLLYYCFTTLRYVALCCAKFCYVVLCCAKFCYVALCCALFCYVVLSFAVSCNVVLRCAMLR